VLVSMTRVGEHIICVCEHSICVGEYNMCW
jgi:hypothetical protein